MNYYKNENCNGNNGWYWGEHIMYFTRALYPLAQSLQHANKREAFIIFNVHMRPQMHGYVSCPSSQSC